MTVPQWASSQLSVADLNSYIGRSLIRSSAVSVACT
jgi:hypothetical protein